MLTWYTSRDVGRSAQQLVFSSLGVECTDHLHSQADNRTKFNPERIAATVVCIILSECQYWMDRKSRAGEAYEALQLNIPPCIALASNTTSRLKPYSKHRSITHSPKQITPSPRPTSNTVYFSPKAIRQIPFLVAREILGAQLRPPC